MERRISRDILFSFYVEKEELLKEIQENIVLRDMYEQLEPELKEEFLNFCTGMKGLKILRDSFFKEVINPEYDPERLEIQKIGYRNIS